MFTKKRTDTLQSNNYNSKSIQFNSIPTEILNQSLRLVRRQPRDAQRPNLGAASQPLQADRDFPPFRLRDYEDVFFAFLVSDAGAEDKKAGQFAALVGWERKLQSVS